MVKNAMGKNEKATPNGADLEVLKKHFGMCFNSDGSLDVEKLKARLEGQVAFSNEGYELKFLGKNYARLLTSLETTTVVVPDKKHNAKPENAKSKNVYISGDNLDALKHLLKSKQGQVKCIYIDPPYNTGSDGFVYNDSFGFKAEELANKLSISEDEAQRILDFTKRGSASHSAWLMFMYPRLMLARDLLAKDGVIFISIDDNEQANLKLMCDEIFGEIGFVANMIWEGAYKNDVDRIGTNHEYVVVYSKKDVEHEPWTLRKIDGDIVLREVARLKKVYGKDYESASKDLAGWFRANKAKSVFAHRRFHLIDERGAYKEDDPTAPGGRKFELINPRTGGVIPLRKNRGWRFDQQTFEKLVKDGRISFISETSIMVRTYFHETETVTPQSVFYQAARSASERLDALFGVDVFSYPKDESIISQFIEMSTDEDSIVVDFFAGSATTAHAIMSLNAELNSRRRYILVQLPEDLDKTLANSAGEAKVVCQNAIDFLDSRKEPHLLDYIGMNRIRLAAAKIAAENPLLAKTMDLGFKHYTLKEVEGRALDKIEKFDLNDNALAATDDVLKEFGVETVLATWLVHDGYGFSAEPKVIDLDGYKAYWMEKHVYLIEPGLSDKGISALFDKFETEGSFNPGNVVVFGYSFSWTQLEALKNNLLKIAANGTNKHVLLDKRY